MPTLPLTLQRRRRAPIAGTFGGPLWVGSPTPPAGPAGRPRPRRAARPAGRSLKAAPRPAPAARAPGRRPSPGTARARRRARGRCPSSGRPVGAALEAPEEAVAVGLGHAGSVVGDRQPQPRARARRIRRDLDRDRRPRRRTSRRCRGAPTGPGRAGPASATASQPADRSSTVNATSVGAERLPRPADPRRRGRRPRAAAGAPRTRAGSRSGAGGPSATAGRPARR